MIIASGNIVNAIGSFLRNLLIARFVSVEDFGIASAVAMTMSIVELTGDLGVERLLIQTPDGDDERLQAAAHGFQLIRGAIGSITLFLVATPIAWLFRIPEAEWALRCVAIAPLLRSFSHLDVARLQRSMRFAPAAWTDSIPPLITTAVTVPLAVWLADYRVMLWVILLQALLQTIVSHLVATRHYQLGFDRMLMRRMLRFGWPLLCSGLLLFGAFQGDRAIVAISFSVRELGLYSPAAALTLIPAMLSARILGSALLPALSRIQSNRGEFQLRLRLCSEIVLCAATGFSLVCLLGGPAILLIAFGGKYQQGLHLIPLFALCNTARLLRVGPNVGAMALGETTNAMVAGIVRLVSIPCGIVAVIGGWGTEGVVVSILIGETLAYISALWTFSRRCKLPYPIPIHAGATFLVCLVLGYGFSSDCVSENPLLNEGPVTVAVSVIATILVATTCPCISSKMRALLKTRLAQLKVN